MSHDKLFNSVLVLQLAFRVIQPHPLLEIAIIYIQSWPGIYLLTDLFDILYVGCLFNSVLVWVGFAYTFIIYIQSDRAIFLFRSCRRSVRRRSTRRSTHRSTWVAATSWPNIWSGSCWSVNRVRPGKRSRSSVSLHSRLHSLRHSTTTSEFISSKIPRTLSKWVPVHFSCVLALIKTRFQMNRGRCGSL